MPRLTMVYRGVKIFNVTLSYMQYSFCYTECYKNNKLFRLLTLITVMPYFVYQCWFNIAFITNAQTTSSNNLQRTVRATA